VKQSDENYSAGIANKCLDLGPEYGITPEIAERIEKYAANLVKWQKAINLVSKKTLPNMWERHILDSLQLVPHIGDDVKVIADMGSGAGLPGVILALFHRWDVHLIESDQRKCIFMRDSARACGVPVTIHSKRIEAVDDIDADLITARALAPLDDLFRLSVGFRRTQTKHLFLKGQSADDELTAARKQWKLQVTKIPSITDPLGSLLNIDEVCPHGN